MTKSRNLITPRWSPTPSERQFVRDHFPDHQTGILARTLGVAYHQVQRLAKSMGLEKSAAFYEGPDSGRLDGIKGASNRFQKGSVPANKGKKMPGHGSDATKFKPGRPAHEAHNYVPIGTTKVSTDGYLVKKVTDDPSLAPARRWEGVHRLVWIEANGPIPAGHVVAFKPGMRTTEIELIKADRLELRTKAEMALAYGIHSYPEEIASVMRLRGNLTRSINKRAKEESHE